MIFLGPTLQFLPWLCVIAFTWAFWIVDSPSEEVVENATGSVVEQCNIVKEKGHSRTCYFGYYQSFDIEKTQKIDLSVFETITSGIYSEYPFFLKEKYLFSSHNLRAPPVFS